MSKTTLAAVMIVAAMLGLYYKVDYSGWVLFFGILVAL